jgi:tRNA pseudouridine32 synthase/23S rRNA pseudouridine746 synthase
LRIRILYEDTFIVVIEKPSNLRSVPGNASGSKRPREAQKTGQEAWIEALESFQDCNLDDQAHQWARNVANSPSLVSIPRKLKPFLRYCERNQARLTPQGEPRLPSDDLKTLANKIHVMFDERQRSFLNLPQATKYEESAFGQLILLGYAKDERPGNLFVVHRLDCETSGVVVFARTQEAASFLSKAWRAKDQVTKRYVAQVKRWPPYNAKQMTGIIELPLGPSAERLKWKVDENGKPSKTLWKIRNVDDGFITLDLTPVTGRTHQLRIHLAEVGSGIEGDTLYGDNPEQWNPDNCNGRRLRLHAECFILVRPHPKTGEIIAIRKCFSVTYCCLMMKFFLHVQNFLRSCNRSWYSLLYFRLLFL